MTATPSPIGPATDAGTAPRRFLRSPTNRVFAGVCGGIAETFGSDPTAVRLAAVALTVLTGIFPLVLVYLLTAIIVPLRGSPQATSAPSFSVTPGQGALVVGALLITLGVVALAEQVLRIDWDIVWPFAFVALGGVLVLGASRRQGPPTPR